MAVFGWRRSACVLAVVLAGLVSAPLGEAASGGDDRDPKAYLVGDSPNTQRGSPFLSQWSKPGAEPGQCVLGHAVGYPRLKSPLYVGAGEVAVEISKAVEPSNWGVQAFRRIRRNAAHPAVAEFVGHGQTLDSKLEPLPAADGQQGYRISFRLPRRRPYLSVGATWPDADGCDDRPDAQYTYWGFWAERAVCKGREATIIADESKRRTRGTRGDDVIVGTGGGDRIDGRGGDDVICGVGGRDRIRGGPGSDRLLGGADRDRCTGGPGRDRVHCERARQGS